MTEALRRSERVDLRMTPDAKRTLQHAASLANKTLTEFMLDTGLNTAFEMLADRRTFAPSVDNPGLRRLLARKPAWEA